MENENIFETDKKIQLWRTESMEMDETSFRKKQIDLMEGQQKAIKNNLQLHIANLIMSMLIFLMLLVYVMFR